MIAGKSVSYFNPVSEAFKKPLKIFVLSGRGINLASHAIFLFLFIVSSTSRILFISSELPEVVKCCDRVLVLRDRNIIGELVGDEIEESNIMKTIAGGAR